MVWLCLSAFWKTELYVSGSRLAREEPWSSNFICARRWTTQLEDQDIATNQILADIEGWMPR